MGKVLVGGKKHIVSSTLGKLIIGKDMTKYLRKPRHTRRDTLSSTPSPTKLKLISEIIVAPTSNPALRKTLLLELARHQESLTGQQRINWNLKINRLGVLNAKLIHARQLGNLKKIPRLKKSIGILGGEISKILRTEAALRKRAP